MPINSPENKLSQFCSTKLTSVDILIAPFQIYEKNKMNLPDYALTLGKNHGPPISINFGLFKW
jgi:hypothetical protein